MFKEILRSGWFTIFALLLLGFFVISVIKLEPPLAAVRKEFKNISQKIGEAEKNFLELEKLGEYLKSDAYLERQARLKLNYKKPDERVVYVYQKTTETQNGKETRKDSELIKILESKIMTNLKNWLEYLINK